MKTGISSFVGTPEELENYLYIQLLLVVSKEFVKIQERLIDYIND